MPNIQVENEIKQQKQKRPVTIITRSLLPLAFFALQKSPYYPGPIALDLFWYDSSLTSYKLILMVYFFLSCFKICFYAQSWFEYSFVFLLNYSCLWLMSCVETQMRNILMTAEYTAKGEKILTQIQLHSSWISNS